jgi:hypothetical protein
MLKLVEETAGLGELFHDRLTLQRVRYKVSRYQGMMEGSGLPIPGLFRIEGSIDFDPSLDSTEWIDVPLTLRLEDGRTLGITVVDEGGRILSEGHGPTKCMCC